MRTPGTGRARQGTRLVGLSGLLVAATAVGVGAGTLIGGTVNGQAAVPTGETAAAGSLPMPTGVASVPPTPSPTPTPLSTPTPVPTPVVVPAPLTGLPVTASAAQQHVVAVMVDDHRGARPQSGFNAAAQVWQAPAESGIPRYMMVFQDVVPGLVGPIRSARQYFVEWASEWDATYVHIGGAPDALATLRSKGRGELVFNADGFRFESSQMWRDKSRPAPHNAFTDGAHLRAIAGIVGATDGPVAAPWRFGPAASTWSRPAGTTIVIKYPYETITYRYDIGSNTYQRFIDTSPTQQIDAGDGQPVAPTNVVILRMQFGPLSNSNPEKHRLDAGDVGSGEAIISTNGRVIHGTWKKASIADPTVLLGPDGESVTLAAGQTFVQVITLSYEYSISEGVPADPGIRER